ncbi:uncharacterized protein [Nicotiana sylvestris]|uniref:Uncharacterized protein LOC104234779 n=1 Tax=Nicotiana sylvestris TaxID=4096 RepID=A0A1U7XID4_NICSY|nr:PREDICTED: uncharacterized protein LOC104234779 [Nicotiana sylvestris]
MSSNKRKTDQDQIDHTTCHPYLCAKNSERNLRRRIAYKKMTPDKKATLLERCRTEYAAKKCRLSEISSANPSDQSHSSSESQRMIPGQAATFPEWTHLNTCGVLEYQPAIQLSFRSKTGSEL